MKTCSKCEIEKPFTEFYKRGNSYKSHCKICSSIYGKGYYLENKNVHNQNMIEHYEQKKNTIRLFKNFIEKKIKKRLIKLPNPIIKLE